MDAQSSNLAAELRAAMQWWQLAGVDCEFSNDATDWLADPREETSPREKDASAKKAGNSNASPGPETAKTRARTIERIDFFGDNPPADLRQFREWWLESPGIDEIGPRGRIAPRGPDASELMVLVIDPEEGDKDRLLSGPQGRLLANFLKAAGIAPDDTYVASALPRHTPMADTASLAARGLDRVLDHHIALAAPKRVLAFGKNILPLLGHEITKDIGSLREINQNSRSVPLMVNEGLDSLLAMPRLKARFWRRWTEWSAR